MRWQTKAHFFRLFGGLPGGNNARYLAQRYVTRRIPRSHETIRRLDNLHYADHMAAIQRHDGDSAGLLYEFGAGWDLRSNIAMWCLGVERQLVVDLHRLAKPSLINRAIAYYREHGIQGEVRRPGQPVFSAFQYDLLNGYGIDYRAPFDAGESAMPPMQLSTVVSTATLEHIPEPDIVRIMRECRRLCRSDAVLSMLIDYQDHWNYADRSISRYNFLRFEDTEWRRWNPPLHHQNRLRHSDYRRLFPEAGFEILEESTNVPAGGLDAVREVPLAKRFRRHAIEDLAATVGRFVLQPN